MADNTQVIVNAFTLLSDDSSAAATKARTTYGSVDSWRNSQAWQVAIAGGSASAIPVAHLVTGVGEMLFLLHKMAYCSWGIGGILGCKVDGKQDLQYILGLWSHAITEDQIREMFDLCQKAAILKAAYDKDPRVKKAIIGGSGIGKITATVATATMPISLSALNVAVNSVPFSHMVLATSTAIPKAAVTAVMGTPHAISFLASKGVSSVVMHVTEKIVGHGIYPGVGSLLTKELVANHFAYQLGILIQNHAGPVVMKFAEKAAAKITKKAAAKAALGFIPLVSALATAGINAWILQGFADSAETYYRLKLAAAR